MTFTIFTKYNDTKDDELSIFCLNNNKRGQVGDKSRAKFQKNKKLSKDKERSLKLGETSSLTSSANLRGINVETRLHAIELAQLEN